MRARAVWLVILSCAVPRLAALAVWPADPSTLYYQLSTSFLQQRRPVIDGELTTHIEPFYPLVLAVLRAAARNHVELVRLLQIAVASIGGLLLYQYVLDTVRDGRAAAIAAVLYAASPYLIRQSVAFMEVTLAVALLIAAAARLRAVPTAAAAIGAGLLLGAVVLTRFSLLPIAVGGVAIAWRRGGASRGALAAAACVAVLAPWMAYSRSVSGAALPGRIGENLFESTSGWAEAIGVPRTNVDLMIAPLDRAVRAELLTRGNANPTRVERDDVMREWALDYVRAHPWRALRMKLANIVFALQPRLLPFTERRGEAAVVDGRLVAPPQGHRPWPFEAAAAVFQAALVTGALVGLWRRLNYLLSDDAFLVVVAVSVLAVSVVFFPTSRLLAPMTFVLMFYAATGVTR